MLINYDCRYFRGDVPCGPHKSEGVHCEGCKYYVRTGERILIIKLDAAGDVLRTTAILPGLKEKYPQSRIWWITMPESVQLFKGNGYVDKVFDISLAPMVLAADEFDMVVNLDAAPLSSRLAAVSRAKKRIGFGYNAAGYVYPLSPEAEEWFCMGLFDDRKKANTKTYQRIMLDICGLKPSDHSIQYALTPEESEFAAAFAAANGIGRNDFVVGLNTGAGGRWEKKKWTEDGLIDLVRLLHERRSGTKILLYGGPHEVERNKRIASAVKGSAIDAGCRNTIREFAALLDLSDIVVTADTMALHLSLALRKKTVAVIGPTSSAEIEMYGLGPKLTADMPCLCCYLKTCDKEPDCMSSISPLEVLQAIESLA